MPAATARLSYEHANKIEAQLKSEVAALMARAEAADQADLPDGLSVPAELARREDRLAAIAEAKAKIEARARTRYAQAKPDYDAKLARQDAKRAAGKKPGGKPLVVPVEKPLPTDQINLTDEDSRIMPVASGGFGQCYNAQAAVAAGSLIVVATDVVQAPNDKRQLEPMLGKLGDLPEDLGEVGVGATNPGIYSGEGRTRCRRPIPGEGFQTGDGGRHREAVGCEAGSPPELVHRDRGQPDGAGRPRQDGRPIGPAVLHPPQGSLRPPC